MIASFYTHHYQINKLHCLIFNSSSLKTHNSDMNRPFRLRRAVLLWSLVVVTWLMATSVQSDESQTENVYDDAEAINEDDAAADTDAVGKEYSYDTAADDDNEADADTAIEGNEAFEDVDYEKQTAKAYGYQQEPQLNEYYHPQYRQPPPQYHQPPSYQPAPVHAPPANYAPEKAKTKKKQKKVFVPVFIPEKEKKKMKIIRVDKGFYIQGGTQLFGKFKSLKHCMKACAVTPACLAGDYNPWLHKCYQHSNFTACNTFRAHPQYVHFSKVPCSVVDAPTGRVTLGASMANGVEQKGIDSLQQCIKKCAIAGGGVAATATSPESFIQQGCFAIDYDFSTHKCFFFGNNVVVTFSAPMAGIVTPVVIYLHCPIRGTQVPTSIGARPNPNVVHITFCPLPAGFTGAG